MDRLTSNHEVERLNDDASEFHVRFYGPEDTLFAGGVWIIHVELPAGYPTKSPTIRFVNRIFHPNIDELSGAVYLDVLYRWSPTLDIADVFEVHLPRLLRCPNPDDPLNGFATFLMMYQPKEYEEKVREFVGRFATKEAVSKVAKEDHDGGNTGKEDDS